MKEKEMHAWQLRAEPKEQELHHHHDDGHTLPSLLEELMCQGNNPELQSRFWGAKENTGTLSML